MASTLLLVDDHVLFREGVAALAQHWDDFEVVGEASNGQEAIELARELLPDIILMDISMPVMNGLEATAQIQRELPTSRVVMLTIAEDEANLFEAIKSGAVGYILKNTPSRRLHSYLQGVMRGEAPMSGVVAAKVLDEFSRRSDAPGEALAVTGEALSEREQEVLQLVAEGLTNQEIGEKLSLSENTIKKHLANVLGKLHLSNRVQAAVYAVREGLAD